MLYLSLSSFHASVCVCDSILDVLCWHVCGCIVLVYLLSLYTGCVCVRLVCCVGVGLFLLLVCVVITGLFVSARCL